jgi:hypothetical protein
MLLAFRYTGLNAREDRSRVKTRRDIANIDFMVLVMVMMRCSVESNGSSLDRAIIFWWFRRMSELRRTGFQKTLRFVIVNSQAWLTVNLSSFLSNRSLPRYSQCLCGSKRLAVHLAS